MNLVIGKFYPPHLGHHWLIDQALADDSTVVVVMWSPDEKIRSHVRKSWLEDAHPYAKVITVKDDLPVDFTDKELSFQHAALIKHAVGVDLGIARINKVYGSEEYVDHLAEYFEAEPVLFDRTLFPISSTEIRGDPRRFWEYLKPSTKAGLAKRIVCLGAESCGTTTLARELAVHYDTVWVPEYGRMYSEGLGNTGEGWLEEDFAHIAQVQRNVEESLARHSRHGLLICDTNTVATRIWELFLSKDSEAHVNPDPADLFILTDLVPWENDGTRWGEHWREEMQDNFKGYLQSGEQNWIQVVGSPLERLEQSIEAIDKHLIWNFEPIAV